MLRNISLLGSLAAFPICKYAQNIDIGGDKNNNNVDPVLRDNKILIHNAQLNEIFTKKHLTIDLTEKVGIEKLNEMVKKDLLDTVADSIQQSQPLANELAKNLVMQLLQNISYAHQTGTSLRNALRDPLILSSVRNLSYTWMHSASTMENIMWTYKIYHPFFFADQSHVRNLATLLAWWTTEPSCKTELIPPLLNTTLQNQELIVKPLGVISGSSLLGIQVLVLKDS